MRTVKSEDLKNVKQTLSGRLLRAGLRGGVVGMVPRLSVHSAVAAAGRNVHAVGLGRKIVEGAETQERCVRVYVVQKLPLSLLSPRDKIEESIDGIPTDVIESPPAFALKKKKIAAAATREQRETCTEKKRKRQRPILGGISTAHFDITAGTLSCFCRSTKHGDDPSKVYALSNNHVYADVNRAAIGDDLYQPGPADGGTGNDHFADLHRFVSIKLGGGVPNRVDAAIGELLPQVEYLPEVCTIGRISAVGRAEEDMVVRKHGRTTGYTEGVVTDESYDALVGMDHADPSVVALFEDQIRIQRIPPYPSFGLGGDSGSLVVEKGHQSAVGLYFAGPGDGSYGVANHIEDVVRELEIELL